MIRRVFFGAVLAAVAVLTQATVFEPREFANAADEARYKQLTEELRCLVCQNQNIAASDADLAKDLRDRVFAMIESGNSDQEIVAFMVARYGEFVLYRPSLSPSTIALWVGPFVIGAMSLLLLWRHLRRRRRNAESHATPLSDTERRRARALLGLESGSNQH